MKAKFQKNNGRLSFEGHQISEHTFYDEIALYLILKFSGLTPITNRGNGLYMYSNDVAMENSIFKTAKINIFVGFESRSLVFH